MELSGKKSIQTIVEDPSLSKYIKTVYLTNTQKYLIDICKKRSIHFEIKPKEFFDRNYSNKRKYKYKYAIAVLQSYSILNLEQLIKINNHEGPMVMLDHIHDPFNLGAILRTCAAAGIKGIIIPKNKQAPIDHHAVLKSSQGYSLKVHIAAVPNLHQSILTLKKYGYLIYSAAIDVSSRNFKEIEYAKSSVLVMGNEGNGVSHIIKKSSDALIHIPMQKGVDSLNVSVAAGIIIFEMIKN